MTMWNMSSKSPVSKELMHLLQDFKKYNGEMFHMSSICDIGIHVIPMSEIHHGNDKFINLGSKIP